MVNKYSCLFVVHLHLSRNFFFHLGFYHITHAQEQTHLLLCIAPSLVLYSGNFAVTRFHASNFDFGCKVTMKPRLDVVQNLPKLVQNLTKCLL